MTREEKLQRVRFLASLNELEQNDAWKHLDKMLEEAERQVFAAVIHGTEPMQVMKQTGRLQSLRDVRAWVRHTKEVALAELQQLENDL